MDEPYEDRITIATPEGVAVELVLAGLGSRFTARILDSLLQFGFVLGWALLAAAAGDPGFMLAILYIALFAGWFLYDLFFELLASGRTPGKRWTGLRVVTTDGAPVTIGASAVRNLLRIVDFLPAAYLVGSLAIVSSSKDQRVGDMVAGTFVVRERRGAPITLDQLRAPAEAGTVDWSEVATWDVSAVTAEEVAVVRQFLQRRQQLDQASRYRLANDLASRLHPRVAGVPAPMRPEEFLERLVAAKDARS